MNKQAIYGVRLVIGSTTWLGVCPEEGFSDHELVIEPQHFATFDINQAHRFQEWMNQDPSPLCKSVVEEREIISI